jgi:hypothetical protein
MLIRGVPSRSGNGTPIDQDRPRDPIRWSRYRHCATDLRYVIDAHRAQLPSNLSLDSTCRHGYFCLSLTANLFKFLFHKFEIQIESVEQNQTKISSRRCFDLCRVPSVQLTLKGITRPAPLYLCMVLLHPGAWNIHDRFPEWKHKDLLDTYIVVRVCRSHTSTIGRR